MGARAIGLAVGALAWAGCFDPTLPAVTCGPSGECPAGLVCDRFDDICRVSPIEPADASSDRPDGPLAVDSGPSTDAATPFCKFADPSLVVCFRFDGDLSDGSIYGHDGFALTGAEFSLGLDGQALDVSATAGPVQIAESAPLDAPEITIEMWMNKSASGNNKGTLFENDNQYSLVLDGGRVRWETCAGVCNSVNTPQQVAVGLWVHVAATHGGGTRRVYIDGQLQAENDASLPLRTDGTDG